MPAILCRGVSKVIDHKQVRASADEWTVVRDTHEAIVSRELFDAVQKVLDCAAQQAKDRKYIPGPPIFERENFLRPLRTQPPPAKMRPQKDAGCICLPLYQQYRIKKGACPGVFIDEMNLLDALADILQEQLDTTLGQYSSARKISPKKLRNRKVFRIKLPAGNRKSNSCVPTSADCMRV